MFDQSTEFPGVLMSISLPPNQIQGKARWTLLFHPNHNLACELTTWCSNIWSSFSLTSVSSLRTIISYKKSLLVFKNSLWGTFFITPIRWSPLFALSPVIIWPHGQLIRWFPVPHQMIIILDSNQRACLACPPSIMPVTLSGCTSSGIDRACQY